VDAAAYAVSRLSVQYSWSHCPVLLHVHLHFKLFIIGQINMDGWMDGTK